MYNKTYYKLIMYVHNYICILKYYNNFAVHIYKKNKQYYYSHSTNYYLL